MQGSTPEDERRESSGAPADGGGVAGRPGGGRHPATSSSWAWPLAFVIVVLATLGSGLYVFDSVRRIPERAVEGGRALVGELRSLAAAFEQGSVYTEFVSYATRTTGTTFLQFATLEQVEVFRRRDTSSLLWGQLALPDVVVEATAPVTYTYFVDLAGRWRFQHEDGHVLVTAPAIDFNPPAVDASAIRLEPRTSSVFRDEEAVAEALRAGLSSLVEERARQHVPRVRETGRRQIEDFVASWLAGTFSDAEDLTVEVVFEDEPPRLEPPRD